MKQATPPNEVSTPIVHILTEVYKELYLCGKKVPKRDRFGLYAKVEAIGIECLTLSIEAALEEKSSKIAPLKKLRISIDVAKRLVRLCQELDLIEEKKYFMLQEKLIEASKMAAGWLAYAQRQGPRERGPYS